MKRALLLLFLTLSCPLAAGQCHAQTPAEVFFEKSVRPLLVERCLDCHSEDNSESEFRADSLGGLLKGGLRGPAIVPGEPEKSLLIRALRHGELLKMPAKKKLPTSEIAILAKWIQDGAVWPNSKPVTTPTESAPDQVTFTDEQRAFWAFQPPRQSPFPAVKNDGWPASPVDWFILAPLEKAGYEPAAKADRRTLLRRATYALTGLPPTPEQIDQFLADDSPDAFARVVDRLLDSPAYGERWGRHWLDVARYADSNGLDENLAYANAFRYRDYVIASLNADKPIDEFIREQLASDLIVHPGETSEGKLARMAATGFLSIGPKMLAEDDPVKMQMDIIDEQIDTVGRAFLGLTLGCARCHDHKFDPIPTADYYSLAGIFKSTHTMDTFTVVAKWHERPMATAEALAAQESHRKKIEALAATINETRDAAAKSVRDEAIRQVGDYLLAAETRRREQKWLASAKPFGMLKPDDLPEGSVLREAESFERGNVLRDTTNYGKGIGVLVNAGPTPNFTEYDIEVAKASRFQVEARYAAAAARPTRLIVNGKLVRSDIADGVTGSWFPESQRWEIEGLVDLKAGKNIVRLEQPTFFPHIDKVLLVPVSESGLPKIEPLVQGRKLVPAFVDQWAKFFDSDKPAEPKLAARWNELAKAEDIQPLREFAALLETLVTKKESAETIKGEADGTLEPFRKFILSDAVPFMISDSIEGEFSEATRKELAMQREEKSKLEKAMPQLPAAMAVEDYAKPEDVRIHLRGSHLTKGVAVPRRFLQVLAGEELPQIPEGQSGRLQLANWLTSRDNPLTARVFVNRVWQWHFGAGLVRTPDNFGRLGERPTHPALLDWLAVEFVESGWSLKKLHRLILLSSTWQQSIHPSSSRQALANASSSPVTMQQSILKTDPENLLWGRMNRRRLTAEEIRDAILVLSGDLDNSMRGTILPTPNRAYVTSTANVNPNVYVSDRRSVYLPVVRSALYEVFQAFDFADPSVLTGKRQSTTVAPQALFMMNSEFVSKKTRRLAERILSDESVSDPDRIQRLWRDAFGRTAFGHGSSINEVEHALSFLDDYESRWRKYFPEKADEARLRAWQSLCRALISSNEFVFVE
jgi:cytochrome c553